MEEGARNIANVAGSLENLAEEKQGSGAARQMTDTTGPVDIAAMQKIGILPTPVDDCDVGESRGRGVFGGRQLEFKFEFDSVAGSVSAAVDVISGDNFDAFVVGGPM